MIARITAALIALASALHSHQPPPARPGAGTGEIRGRVLRADGRPLPRATVQIVGAEHRVMRSANAGDDGRFEFTGLARDAYTLTAQKPGFLQIEFGQRRPGERGQPIAVGDGETRDRIDIVLPRGGAISGRITDENGDPVEGVTVRVLRPTFAADRRLLLDVPFAPPRQTNDVGRYRVYGLPPGRYVVAAGVGLRAGATGYAYAATYFPGAPTAADAQLVAVDVSEDVSGIDLTVGRVPTFRVGGIARDSAGQALAGGLTLGLRADTHAVGIPPVSASLSADGHFLFSGVPPGDYVLQAVERRAPQSREAGKEGEFAWRYVTVGDRSIDDLTIATSKGSTLRGRVEFDGDAGHDLSITAFPVDFDRSPNTGGPPPYAAPRDDATFELSGLHGPRRLTLSGGAREWSIKSIRANGLDITDAVLSFGTADQSLADVEVTLTTHGAAVTGTVIDARGQRAAGYTVIMFAVDRSRWYRNSRFMKLAAPQNDGSFRVAGLPPTEYFVAAVDRMDGTEAAGEWQDPAVLESLVPGATRIVLAEAQQLTLSPRLIVR